MTSTMDATHERWSLRSLKLGTPVLCPDLDCGRPAEIIDTWVWSSTEGPVPHARTRCRLGHVFTPPCDWLIPTDH